VTPMASRAAMKLWSRVSSKTKEKTPSSMSMKFSPCSSYYIMVNKSYASTVWLNCRLLFVQFVFGDMDHYYLLQPLIKAGHMQQIILLLFLFFAHLKLCFTCHRCIYFSNS
jgi:hypothetical protein